MGFWTFDQNNVGGVLVGPDHVIVEATDTADAAERLKAAPFYVNDACECCGSRWDLNNSQDPGTAHPAVYDMTPLEYLAECPDKLIMQLNLNGSTTTYRAS